MRFGADAPGRRHRMTNGAMHGLLPRHLKTSWWRSGLLSRAEPRRPRRPGSAPMPSCWIQALASEKMWTKTGFFCSVLRTDHRGRRWLVGASRKSFIGAVTGVREPRERVPGSLVAAVLAMQGGAEILRVHDVAAHVQTVHAFVAARNAGFEIGQ